AFREEAGFLQAGADLLELIRRHGFACVQHKLAGWLAATAQHGARDDITLGMLSRIAPMPPRSIAAAPQREMRRQDVSGHRHAAMPVRPDDSAAAHAERSALTPSSLPHAVPPPPATSRRQQTDLQTRRRSRQAPPA